ncbi:hypothetical protein D9Q98_005008 [Chlorella vulgaris]|uniref:Katanin p80 subunit C-terminal domain-containing protein n=1 Tax=Chlorella vulgaris TaxID=3077 RepID=A0A9D4TNM3_CHLVU|nr:hypothetical protein D9Q98_005008 [Chlorella vulgaris]
MASKPQPDSRASASLLLRLQRTGGLACAQLHAQGSFLLAGCESGALLIFATSNGSLVQRLQDRTGSPCPATCVAWAEVEQLEHVVAGDQAGDVRLWDMESGQLVCKLEAHGLGVSALACMAPVSLLATGSADTSIKLWLLGAASNTRSTSGACAVAAGNSGDRTHQTQQPWSPKAAVHTLQGHSAPITRLQFTPDGEMLISGDESGCLRVWHVACGRAGRLLQELAGSHTAAVTGIACHPEERLMATCSLDGTVKVWDLDAQFGTCIGVHAPAGCGEVRAVAFAAGGRALLAAYPTGLRTFTLDPLTHHDSADVPWREVASIAYTDGKCMGMSLSASDVGLHCVDLTKLRAFAKLAARSNRAEHSLRDLGSSLARKLGLGQRGQQFQQAADGPASIAAVVPNTIPAAWPATAAAAGTQLSGVAMAPERRLQQGQTGVAAQKAAQAEARAETAAPATHALSGTTAPRGTLRQAQHAVCATTTAHTKLAPPVGAPMAVASPSHPAKASRLGHRPSAQENLILGSMPGDGSTAGPKLEPALAAGLQPCNPAAPPATLAVAMHGGFQAAARQGWRVHRDVLRAKTSLWRDVARLLRRGALREAITLLQGHNDLCLAAQVVRSGALHKQRDRFTLDVCTAAVPLLEALVASDAQQHGQAVLQLLDAILERWGAYALDVLSAPSHGRVDLELDRRQKRSRALCSGLQRLAPAVARVAPPLGGLRCQEILGRLVALGEGS